MNSRNRTKKRETLVNKVEDDTIADHLRDIGMAFSTWSRLLVFGAIAEHDAKYEVPMESRKCRDTPVANRASAKHTHSGNPTARHRDNARSGFGGATRPIRV